jgi:hypothetical protein
MSLTSQVYIFYNQLIATKDACMFAVTISNEFTKDHYFSRADKVVENFYLRDRKFLEEHGR